jgi:asparagine synthase (glutamine-hydrolysing)
VLSGEGADELFAGYVGYQFDRLRRMQGKKTGSVEEERLRERLWGNKDFFYEKNYLEWRENYSSMYSDTLNEMLATKHALNSTSIGLSNQVGLDDVQRRTFIDFKMRISDHLISDHGDRMAYANSIEARYPFLDIHVIEFASSIPSNLKLNNFKEKYILKKLAQGQVPNEILNRPKFSFVAPGVPEILKMNPEYVLDMLSYETNQRLGFFNPDVIEKLKHRYMEKGFRLNLPFENDLLIIALTFNIFMDKFHITGCF